MIVRTPFFLFRHVEQPLDLPGTPTMVAETEAWWLHTISPGLPTTRTSVEIWYLVSIKEPAISWLSKLG